MTKAGKMFVLPPALERFGRGELLKPAATTFVTTFSLALSITPKQLVLEREIFSRQLCGEYIAGRGWGAGDCIALRWRAHARTACHVIL